MCLKFVEHLLTGAFMDEVASDLRQLLASGAIQVTIERTDGTQTQYTGLFLGCHIDSVLNMITIQLEDNAGNQQAVRIFAQNRPVFQWSFKRAEITNTQITRPGTTTQRIELQCA